jgi:DNA-binding NarL/FixJ family response regulator
MDLMMPRGSMDSKPRNRSSEADLAVKVLAVTSLSVDNAIRQEMYRSGADAFLGKRDVATALVPMIRSLHKASVSPDSLLT